MRRILSSIIIIMFLIWLFPLGVFIKPNDEKKVCGGQRAICLCSHAAKGQTAAAKKMILGYTASSEKETSSSGSNTNFLTVDFKTINAIASSKLINHTPNLYSLIVCKSVEHVPKV